MYSSIDRMNGILLAKSIYDKRQILDVRGDLDRYISRLSDFNLFSSGEIAKIADVTEYRVKAAVHPASVLKARSGVEPRHLDHLLRMVTDKIFAQKQIEALVNDGATISAVSRVTGLSARTLKRWMEHDD